VTPTAAGRRAFILANTAVNVPPLVPDLSLHMATEITPLWQASEQVLQDSGVPPPFWAFAWAGGQALARYVLDNPEAVAGAGVLDLAAGCGLAGLAAARAGAVAVTCADIDPLAAEAVVLNAALNGLAGRIAVETADLLAVPGPATGAWDVILAGDVCYERPMAARVTRFLQTHAAAGTLVLLGDPGRAYVPAEGLEPVARFAVATTLELEDRAVRETTVYRLRPPSG
jgi:predicted nicotinamide N-methyase